MLKHNIKGARNKIIIGISENMKKIRKIIATFNKNMC